MKRKRKIPKWLIRSLWVSLFCSMGWSWYRMERQIPKQLHIVAQEEETVRFSLPFEVTFFSDSEEVVLRNESNIPSHEIRLKTDEKLSLYAKHKGSYQLNLKLFGAIPFREIQVDVVEEAYAIPCGMPIGIYLESDGVLVIGTGRVTDAAGNEVEPCYGILESGDYIEAINGEPLQDKEALITNLNRIGKSEALLRIRRNGELLDLTVNPVQAEDGSYKLGAWVRDDTQGIGTLTYVDLNGNFGALGHGISDSDTGEVVEIERGSLYETEILGIEKGTIGHPGVMAGVIYYGPGCLLGSITANTENGIYGTVNEKMKRMLPSEAIPIAHKQEVKKGQAWIRSDVSGQSRDYEIEILRMDFNPIQENKSLVFRVVDEELLRLTGGIVQGMSGSPILQDGKLIGAVTHVLVNDPTRGYGIFIENMLEH